MNIGNREIMGMITAGGVAVTLSQSIFAKDSTMTPKTITNNQRPNVLFILVDDMGWRDAGVRYAKTVSRQGYACG